MELFSIFVLAFGSSIVVGYLGVAFEHGAKKLESNHSISKAISRIFPFPILENFIDFMDSLGTIPEHIQKILRKIKLAIYASVAIVSIILVFLSPPYLILVIFSFIIWLILKPTFRRHTDEIQKKLPKNRSQHWMRLNSTIKNSSTHTVLKYLIIKHHYRSSRSKLTRYRLN